MHKSSVKRRRRRIIVNGERGRRKSVTRGGLRSARRLRRAKLNDNARRRRKTAKKLHNCAKVVSVKLQSLWQGPRKSNVVVQLRVVVIVLWSRPGQIPLKPPASAALPHFQKDMYEQSWSHRSIEQSTKTSRDSCFCVWLYRLVFAGAC